MISVIVPVYNVEPYLRKCLDSIVNQTYRDLEILVIDDGSTDGSGKICDEYAEKDERVKVFHTKNRGLSCVRNLGLDEAKGEWIGFVDSDDWIEPDMYECLLSRAEETGADVVECGVFLEYRNRRLENTKEDVLLTGTGAVNALLQGKLSNTVWSKLWNKGCFLGVRFPESRIFEEYAVTYRLLYSADKVGTIPLSRYHYTQRLSGISKKHNMKGLTDLWLSNKERYDFLRDIVSQYYYQELLRSCAFSIARTWLYYNDCDLDDKKKYSDIVRQMNDFSREHFPLFGFSKWNIKLRIAIFFTHYTSNLAFWMVWLLNKLYRGLKGAQLFYYGV